MPYERLSRAHDRVEGKLARLDASLRQAGNITEPIRMYLAGGLAVNYYCGTRYTEDVDASFSHRFLLPKDLTVNYRRRDGTEAFIYFDHNYNTSFALLHDEFEEHTREWEGLGHTGLVQLRVLSPLDLAVSKIARFSEQDQADILALAREGLFSAEDLCRHAAEAMKNYVGDQRPIRTSLELLARRIQDQR